MAISIQNSVNKTSKESQQEILSPNGSFISSMTVNKRGRIYVFDWYHYRFATYHENQQSSYPFHCNIKSQFLLNHKLMQGWRLDISAK